MRKEEITYKNMENETTKRYSEIATYYASDWRGINTPELRREYDKFLSYIGSPPKIIADIGCGTGKAGKYFLERGFNVVSVDLSFGMLNELIKNVEPSKLTQIEPVLANMVTLPFVSCSFDAIWCMASLVHLNQEAKKIALREFNRILRPNGFLYLSVQNLLSKKHILRVIESCFYDIGYDKDNRFYKRQKSLREIASTPFLSFLIQGYAYLDQRHWFFPTKLEILKGLRTAGFEILESGSPFDQRIYFLALKNQNL